VLEAPLRQIADPPREFVTLANVYISTSGDARQHLVVDGKRYSHVIDPRSGDPVSGRSSVTVIAPRGHLADGWATALSVLGPEKGFPLLEKQPGVSALMVVERDGREERFTSPRWQPTERTQPRDAAKDKE
jgi:thiamine biosynthesis lipoprotein